MSEDAAGGVRRRLAAILFAGYKRLQPGDEASTFADTRELKKYLIGLTLLRTEILEPQIPQIWWTHHQMDRRRGRAARLP